MVDGIRHNIPFLSALMAHPRWHAGRLSTGFIAEEYPEGFHPDRAEGAIAETIAAVAAAIDHVLGERKRRISGQLTGRTVTARASPRGPARRRRARRSTSPRGGGIAVRFVTRRASGRGARAGLVLEARRSGVDRDDSTGSRSRCRCGRSPTASRCRISGVEAKAFVYTESEAAAARLMPVKKPPDTGK